jgi:iron complex transport system substrate-binding protein
VVVVGGNCDVKGIVNNVRLLSGMLDAEKKAEELIEFVEGYANLVIERTQDLDMKEKPRVYHECAFGKYRTTAAGTSADECITLAGGVNIAHNEVQKKPIVSGEWVTINNPDIVISQISTMSPATAETLLEKNDEIMSRTELKDTNAVRDGKIYVSHLFLRRGPRLVGYLLYLAKWFHPKLFEDIDPAAVENEMLRKFYGIDLKGTWAYP